MRKAACQFEMELAAFLLRYICRFQQMLINRINRDQQGMFGLVTMLRLMDFKK